MKLKIFVFLLGILASTAHAGQSGQIAHSGSPLMRTADAIMAADSQDILCMLSDGDAVELLGEFPLRNRDGKVVLPGFYKHVLVHSGSCAGKDGWIATEKFRGR